MIRLLLASLAAFTISAFGQTASSPAPAVPTVQMDYTNADLVPGHWVLDIHPDGSGHFQSERGPAKRATGDSVEAPDIDRDIRVSERFARHAFDIARKKHKFQMNCDSRLQVAFQGLKKLSYTGADGQGTCTFIYSRDKDIQELGDSLVSVADMLLEGARIQLLLVHDRLGLDHETEVLSSAMADGRAQQIGSIRDILDRVLNDPQVMDRVKKRVRGLLAQPAD